MISRIDSLGNYRKHYQLKMQKHDNSQRQISQDHDGRLWVFSKNEALNYYDKNADEFLFFSISRTNCESAPPKIKKIYFDKQNNLWIAKQPKGLVKVSFKKDLFSSLRTGPSRISIFQLNEKYNGRCRPQYLGFGSKNGDIQVYDSNKRFIGFLNSTGRLSRQVENFDAVYALLQDQKGNIWIGTRNKGLIKLIPNGKLNYQLKYYKNDPAGQVQSELQFHIFTKRG